jgi:hypothetical protein
VTIHQASLLFWLKRQTQKPPASERDLHRPIAATNDLDGILCWREQRSVSRQLVINYNRMKFMLRPNKDIGGAGRQGSRHL